MVDLVTSQLEEPLCDRSWKLKLDISCRIEEISVDVSLQDNDRLPSSWSIIISVLLIDGAVVQYGDSF